MIRIIPYDPAREVKPIGWSPVSPKEKHRFRNFPTKCLACELGIPLKRVPATFEEVNIELARHKVAWAFGLKTTKPLKQGA